MMMGAPETDPFLMLDELRGTFSRELGGGFPPHPHRGMQTLTYVLSGGIVHEDSNGHRGEITDGGAQWMSAGRGIVHSEMPPENVDGEFHGFQIWINLPAEKKMQQSRYRDVSRAELATLEENGCRLVAISGSWQLGNQEVTGPLDELAAEGSLAELQVPAGGTARLVTNRLANVVGYLFDGSVRAPAQNIDSQHLLLTGPGDTWDIEAGDAGARLMLLKGDPIGEPVAAYGPFVMNTEEEIRQAVQDYQDGTLARPA